MAINFGREKLLTYGEAAQLLPKGSRPSYSTFWRWWNRGIRGVRLETVLVGGKRFTTAEAMQRFADALSARDVDRFPADCSPRRRERNHSSAEAELRRQGVI